MRAIISDIHANLEALETVLKDIEKRGISEIICLGDIVGYGPDPAECADIARKFKLVLMGNHDEALVQSAIGFTMMAREAIEWTKQQLKSHWFSSRAKKGRWRFLDNLLLTHKEDNVLFVHGSPRQSTTEYILRSDTEILPGSASSKLEEIFNMIDHLCFVGHTHEPGIITEKYNFLSPSDINNTYKIKRGEKLIVNVGSVGQPRDGDNQACYVTFDGKVINYHRVGYDYTMTKKKIFKVPKLDRRFGERLAIGR